MTETTAIKKLTSISADSAAKLKGIWIPIRKILTFSPADDLISSKKNLSVSIEKGRLSVAYGSRFLSGITIKGVREYFFEEGKYPQPKDLASSLALTINEFGAKRADITLSIPKAWTIIKTAEFPSTVKENISDVVSYEMDKLTPFIPEEEVFFDFRVLKDNGERLTLLIIAANADTIRPYINALNKNGLNVSRITVNLSGMGTLCQYMDKNADTVFVEIDKNGYEAALFVNGSMITAFAGTFSTDGKISNNPPSPPFTKGGMGGLAGDEKTKIDMISADIKSLIDTAKSQGRSPQIVALLKDKSPTLKELFKLQINMPVKIMGETDIKPGAKSPSGIEPHQRTGLSSPHKEIPYAAVGSVMQSLWPKAKGPNLLKKGLHEKQKTPFTLTIILMLAILSMWVLYIITPLKTEGKRLEEISRQIGLKQEEAKRVDALKKEADALSSEIAVIYNLKEGRPMTLDILKELTSIIPETAWLTNVKITGTSVEIKGYASSATELLPKLEASKYFSNVEFASPTIRDARMNSDRFVIKMEIDKGEKLKNAKK